MQRPIVVASLRMRFPGSSEASHLHGRARKEAVMPDRDRQDPDDPKDREELQGSLDEDLDELDSDEEDGGEDEDLDAEEMAPGTDIMNEADTGTGSDGEPRNERSPGDSPASIDRPSER
jgi:hypothetical protein